MKLPTLAAPVLLLLALCACRSTPGAAAAEREIVIADQRIAVDAPVVRWEAASPARGAGPAAGRAPQHAGDAGGTIIPADCDDLGLIARVVDQLVLHHAWGSLEHPDTPTWRRHAAPRAVHFTIEVDGTIRQHLDVRDMGRHASRADYRSVGVELVGPGVHRPKEAQVLEQWYERDAFGLRLTSAADPADASPRSASSVHRPRRGRVSGKINGYTVETVDFTQEQYDSLVRLTAALVRVLPGLFPDIPRDARGFPRTDALSEAEQARYRGLLGHFHVDPHATGPGPAFDWEGYVRAVRAELARARR